MRHLTSLALTLCCTSAVAEDALVKAGQKTALFTCGRCHVVPGGNPFGSIGSTPSFAVMRGYEDWKIRFQGFYAEAPHIAITQIEGITDAFVPERPSPIAPMELTMDDLDAIMAFVETIEPKDVGMMN